MNTRQSIIWTNADPIHWRIYAGLGGGGGGGGVKVVTRAEYVDNNPLSPI